MNITPLPLVEKEADYIAMRMIHNETGHYEPVYQAELKRLTQDRDLAYTSLIKGIEGMKKVYRENCYQGVINNVTSMPVLWVESDINIHTQALSDIINNVIKPLYGKE